MAGCMCRGEAHVTAFDRDRSCAAVVPLQSFRAPLDELGNAAVIRTVRPAEPGALTPARHLDELQPHAVMHRRRSLVDNVLLLRDGNLSADHLVSACFQQLLRAHHHRDVALVDRVHRAVRYEYDAALHGTQGCATSLGNRGGELTRKRRGGETRAQFW